MPTDELLQTNNSPPLPTKSILLLEDESALGSAHVRVLIERGYRVVLALTAADACQFWKECRPDLVLLSFRRFDQGVLDFLETIQAVTPNQRIAFLQHETGYLAPVFQDEKLVRRGQGPEDYLDRIDALLTST